MKIICTVLPAAVIMILASSCSTNSNPSEEDADVDATEGEVLDGEEDGGRDQEGDADDGRDPIDGETFDGNGDPVQDPDGQDQDGQERDGDVVSEEEEEPVCGNGIREATEASDDGGTDPCGPCNADCTAAGSGSLCGDGIFCPDTEFCDDGGTDPGGPCNADCTGPGNGTTCGLYGWGNRFGDLDNQLGHAIDVDNLNNAVLTGMFSGAVDFGGGALTSAGGNDIFVAKFGP